VARTIVYIDGFNLYYRALKGTPHKWLDIEAMSRAALPASCVIERVNYYTAHISGRVDPGAPRRQHAYLRALATLPKVAIHYGNFLVTQKWAGLVQPPEFRPTTALPAGAAPQVAYVWKTEEKGSDVNLGVHLVRDAFRGAFELGGVSSNRRKFRRHQLSGFRRLATAFNQAWKPPRASMRRHDFLDIAQFRETWRVCGNKWVLRRQICLSGDDSAGRMLAPALPKTCKHLN